MSRIMPPLSVAGSCDKRLMADLGLNLGAVLLPAIFNNTKLIIQNLVLSFNGYCTDLYSFIPYGHKRRQSPAPGSAWSSLNISNKLATSATFLPTESTLQAVPSIAWWSGMPKRCRFSVSRPVLTPCNDWSGRPTRNSSCVACTGEELCRYTHIPRTD